MLSCILSQLWNVFWCQAIAPFLACAIEYFTRLYLKIKSKRVEEKNWIGLSLTVFVRQGFSPTALKIWPWRPAKKWFFWNKETIWQNVKPWIGSVLHLLKFYSSLLINMFLFWYWTLFTAVIFSVYIWIKALKDVSWHCHTT